MSGLAKLLHVQWLKFLEVGCWPPHTPPALVP